MSRPVPSDWPNARWSELHTVQGVTWHVQRAGADPATHPTILLVHGTGGSTHSWADIAPALATDHHVVNVDLPGHGFTHVPAAVERARNSFSLAGMSQLLRELLTTLGTTPHVAVGHSAGVSVLLRMTVDGLIAPRHIVGICPALVPPPAWYVALVAPLLGAILESDTVSHSTARLAAGTRLIERMLASTGSPLRADQLARYRQLCSNPEHVHAAIAMMARWDLPSLFRDIGVLRTPVHLMAGRQDRWIPVAPLSRAVERIPGVRLSVEEGGHLLPEERPELVVRAIRDVAAG